MAEQEVTLMKGNEAIAHAAIRCGADGYFGYPITPQSEIIETLALLKPWETTGMVVLQAESETSSINMIYGGAGAGKRVLTSSSSVRRGFIGGKTTFSIIWPITPSERIIAGLRYLNANSKAKSTKSAIS